MIADNKTYGMYVGTFFSIYGFMYLFFLDPIIRQILIEKGFLINLEDNDYFDSLVTEALENREIFLKGRKPGDFRQDIFFLNDYITLKKDAAKKFKKTKSKFETRNTLEIYKVINGSFQNYPFYYKVCKKDDPTEKPIEGSFHPKNMILFVPSEKTVNQSQASNLPARQVSQRTKKKAGFSVT